MKVRKVGLALILALVLAVAMVGGAYAYTVYTNYECGQWIGSCWPNMAVQFAADADFLYMEMHTEGDDFVKQGVSGVKTFWVGCLGWELPERIYHPHGYKVVISNDYANWAKLIPACSEPDAIVVYSFSNP